MKSNVVFRFYINYIRFIQVPDLVALHSNEGLQMRKIICGMHVGILLTLTKARL